jgi:hypothetical protein
MPTQVFFQVRRANPLGRRGLAPVEANPAVVPADQNVVILMFGQPAVQPDAVEETENLAQGAVEPHFLAETSMGGRQYRFAR